MPAFLLLSPVAVIALMGSVMPPTVRFHPPRPAMIVAMPATSFADSRLPRHRCAPASALASLEGAACAPALAARIIRGEEQRAGQLAAFRGTPMDTRMMAATLPGLGALFGNGTSIALTGRMTLGHGGAVRVGLDSIADQRLGGYYQEQRRIALDAAPMPGRPASF